MLCLLYRTGVWRGCVSVCNEAKGKGAYFKPNFQSNFFVEKNCHDNKSSTDLKVFTEFLGRLQLFLNNWNHKQQGQGHSRVNVTAEYPIIQYMCVYKYCYHIHWLLKYRSWNHHTMTIDSDFFLSLIHCQEFFILFIKELFF